MKPLRTTSLTGWTTTGSLCRSMDKKITDQFGNELKVGDNVCFVANPNSDWRQTKKLARKKVIELIPGKKDWLILEDSQKVSPTRVVKCY